MKQPKNVNQVGRLSSLWKVKVKVKLKSLSLIRLFVTPWTVAHQASQSMGFSRQESWNGLPFPSPGDLSNPGIKARSPTLQADTYLVINTPCVKTRDTWINVSKQL